ncbi:hypothetical protein L479_03000 [Exiguobacterium sp. S17]|nr:hypothetical protein L479_03000 [Exiguobacterium sp. S17]
MLAGFDVVVGECFALPLKSEARGIRQFDEFGNLVGGQISPDRN